MNLRPGKWIIINWKSLSLTFFAIFFIIPGLWINFWKVNPSREFYMAGRNSECLIPGRLAYSRDHGIFSMGAIPGACIPAPEGVSMPEFQYLVYEQNLSYDSFQTHNSQLGFQTFPMYFISWTTGMNGTGMLNVSRLIASVFLAVVVLLISFWSLHYYGFLSAFFVLLSAFLSTWFNALGRNIWFVFWVHYIPMLMMIYLLYREEKTGRFNIAWAGILFFLAVMFKMLMTSFEFVTSSLFMPLVPLVWYAVYKRWGWKKLLARGVFTGGISMVAVFIAIIILSFQISAIEGTFKDGLHYVAYSYFKRTGGNPAEFANDPIIVKSLLASRWEVLKIQSAIKAIDLGFPGRFFKISNRTIPISYFHLVILFMVASITGILIRRRLRPNDERLIKFYALLIACWFSIIGPLSWFLIFKAHSFIHRRLDMMAWHMPFIFFGFMLTGYVIWMLFTLNGKDAKISIPVNNSH